MTNMTLYLVWISRVNTQGVLLANIGYPQKLVKVAHDRFTWVTGLTAKLTGF